MTTGAPIYLVSACMSGEEFISAFRRYADRNGVMFIPIAEPLPAGRQGRFALALSNGGVMVEGQAEVVSSAKTPSVLYGRVGMTLKFHTPDEPSQTILSELEKARTSLRPPAPSVPPRHAEIPAEPRPKPPAPSGRIDAVNALAECVVIGDVSTLSRDSDLGTIPPPMGKSSSAPVPIATPKSPSAPSTTMPPPFHTKGGSPDRSLAKSAAKPPATPGIAADRSKSASIPPAVPPLPASIGKATTMGMPALDRKPSGSIPATPPITGAALTATTLGMPTVGRAATTTPAPNAPPPPTPLIAEPPAPLASAAAATSGSAAPSPPVPATRDEAVAAALKFAKAVEARGAALPDETVKGSPPGFALSTETIRGTLPASAPIASPPPPIQYPGTDESDEKTDLINIPIAPQTRRTEIGVAVTPSGALVLPSAPPAGSPTDDETRETSRMAAEEPTNPLDVGLTPVEQVDPLGSTQAALRLSKIQPTIEEPSGDWTMSTNDGSLTIMPRKPPPEAKTDEPPRAEKPAPKGPPTGDFIIALDPSRPDGWSEPSKVEKSPEGELPGPPVLAVSSDEPLDSNARAQPEITADEPKIQIDPTLIEPLTSMPAVADDDEPAEPPSPMPPPPAASTPMLPLAAPQLPAQPGSVPIFPAATTPGIGPIPITPPRPMQGPPGSFVTPVGESPQLASASGPGPALFEPGDLPRLETHDGASRAAQKRKQRWIVIAASAAAAVLIAVIVIIATSGDDTPAKEPTSTAPPETTPTPIQPAATSEQPPPPPKPEEAVEPDTAVVLDTAVEDDVAAVTPPESASELERIEAPPADCTVTITSVPSAAAVSIGGDAKGPTPVTVTLPCGVATKVTVKKARYLTATRTVKPKPNGRAIKIALARPTFTVKVSSSPQGATVTLGGKTLGMTPTTVKVPAFESSTLKIAKDGYVAEMSKVTPKTTSVNVTLKKSSTKRAAPLKKPK